MGRERRRKDLERMKRRARKFYPNDKEGTLANHLKNCSCSMCCNQRRNPWLKGDDVKTRQERETDLEFKEGTGEM